MPIAIAFPLARDQIAPHPTCGMVDEVSESNARGEVSLDGGVSVVICCHNSARRLPETLRHLAKQQVPPGLPWEVVIVDNVSRDGTAEEARRLWPDNAPACLRVVQEPQAGTANARRRGIVEASHEFVSFLDDDNWVPPDWIVRVAGFFSQHPEFGVVGGPSTPVFETPAPAWFGMMAIRCAIGEQYPSSGDITESSGTLLWTAGANLRRAAALALFKAGFQFVTCGGSPLPLRRGEDTELFFALRATGQRLFYDTSMVIRHFMPTERLSWNYALAHFLVIGEPSPVYGIYLMALEHPPYDSYPAWKQTWTFQSIKTLVALVIFVVRHPLACLRLTEGSYSALQYRSLQGQLLTCLRMFGTYAKIRESLRSAAWVRAATSKRRKQG